MLLTNTEKGCSTEIYEAMARSLLFLFYLWTGCASANLFLWYCFNTPSVRHKSRLNRRGSWPSEESLGRELGTRAETWAGAWASDQNSTHPHSSSDPKLWSKPQVPSTGASAVPPRLFATSEHVSDHLIAQQALCISKSAIFFCLRCMFTESNSDRLRSGPGP